MQKGYYYHLTYLERPITAILSDNPETSSFSVDEIIYQGRKCGGLLSNFLVEKAVLDTIENKKLRR